MILRWSPRLAQQGIPADWLDAARRSPVYALAKTYKVALPLHPEYRTMPMVWYIPPLSPIVDLLRDQGHDAESAERPLRGHPSAADSVGVPGRAVHRGRRRRDRARAAVLAAMRAHMRNITLEQPQDDSIAASVGMTDQSIREMYRLMAIAKYDERYVIPKAHVEQAHELEELGCSLDFDGGPYESGPFGEASGRPSPVAVETFQALQQRQTSELTASGDQLRGRVNLLNWDGNGTPEGLFPTPKEPA